ncbi:hypothetical protein CV770_26725 [Bradyrhizobium sp. AC87j1]|uniref:hypothetical protein n=1 Tax=Bradyrhizobium sp. AC87j1 TaxID=2055894 RepID=UPI000CEC9E15|nr:hypothetical protein [Bradyrhizobium sp. AC87j1]PPQ16342.1 hypothetical protein CV770_26725 [Bradyrhizobium sp. AC87j1]
MTSEFSHKVLEMRATSLNEAADLLRQVAGERRADESLKAVFRRLSRKLSDWSENRIRDVWHRDPRIKIRADEVSQLRALVEPKRKTESIHDLEELRATVARLARYEALLERLDEEFYGPQISAASDQLGEARRLLGKGRSRV